MYRQYEDPWKVSELLDEAETRLEIAQAAGEDEDYIIDLMLEVYALKDRLRFAWADQEYDEMVTLYGY